MCGSWCFLLPPALSASDKTLNFSTKSNWALSTQSAFTHLSWSIRKINLLHAANEIVDASDYGDVFPSITSTEKESTGGKVGKSSNCLPPLWVFSIHCHCHLGKERKWNVMLHFLFLNEKCRMTQRCKKCHLSCLLRRKLFGLGVFLFGSAEAQNCLWQFL